MEEDNDANTPETLEEGKEENSTEETPVDTAVDQVEGEQVGEGSERNDEPLEDVPDQDPADINEVTTKEDEVASKLVLEPEADGEAATLKLEGIEGAEDPPLEHAQLELLSEHQVDDEVDELEKEEAAAGGEGEGVDVEELAMDDDEEERVLSEHGMSPEYRVFDREVLIQQYRDALEERAKIQASNQQMQNKLSEYFKKKKTEERGQEIEKNANDQEQRYMKYMSNLEELQKHEAQQSASIKIQLEEMQRKCSEMERKVEDASNEFVKFKYETAADAINSRSGKQIPAKDLEQYQASEAKKEQEVIAVRLENIKLKNRLKKREQQLKAKEELAEGLHLIDFEQLKIENQTYHEKIEERNEELLKLRRKITTTVQVLTHLKEKLQFVQGENGEQRSKLRDIEVTVAHKRDILTRLKQVRDALRIDNNKLKHKAGLLGNKPLLKDYEVRKDEGEELQAKLDMLKKQHVDLNLALQGVKKKIDKANPVVHAM